MSALGCILTALVLGVPVQQGGNQGPFGAATDGSADGIDQAIQRYLNGPEADPIVTPGDPVEYRFDLKAGEVILAEARSDTFDPALQVVDEANKTVAANDDRYPGDQRPLVLFRAPAAGAYKVKVGSFRDREGGKVYIRIKSYASFDLPASGLADLDVAAGQTFLVRIPMRKGEVREERTENIANSLPISSQGVIAPGGLPDLGLARRLQPAVHALLAPVDGDYYVVHTAHGPANTRGKVRLGTRALTPAPLARVGTAAETKVPTNLPGLAEFTVKKGEFLQVAAVGLDIRARVLLAEPPDLTKYDLAKPETNPFYPRQNEDPGPAFDLLPARTGDPRLINFRARRDTRLWLATNAQGPQNTTYALQLRPAAQELAEGTNHAGKLRIANYDHWGFDAKPGDVMNFSITASDFREVSVMRDPDLEEIRHMEMALDQINDTWRMIVQKPGRYLLTVSSLGDGGSGDYAIARTAYRPKEFAKGKPAKGEIANGEVQVWRFTAAANDPLFVRWKSTNWNYDVAIYDSEGRPTGLQRERISETEEIGILNPRTVQTYVIVLTGKGAKASYSIDLSAIAKG